jgi:outer membrane murein-binding lipoprotein Lpp
MSRPRRTAFEMAADALALARSQLAESRRKANNLQDQVNRLKAKLADLARDRDDAGPAAAVTAAVPRAPRTGPGRARGAEVA